MKSHFLKKINLTVLFIGCSLWHLVSAQTPAQKKVLDDNRRKWDTPAWTDTVKNPYANNAAITDTGRICYNKYCTVCHGQKGKGDGVASAGMTERPADHTSPLVQLQTDGSLYYELSKGHGAMPTFKASLSDKQRWACINYIRLLGKPAAPKNH